MTPSAIITRATFEDALKAARDLRPATVVQGLAAVPDAAMLGRLQSAWDAVEQLLAEIFVRGRDQVTTLVGAATAKVEEIFALGQGQGP